MKNFSPFRLIFLPLLFLFSCTYSYKNDDFGEQAEKLAKESIIVDGHVDLPYRLREKPEDVSVKTSDGDFDYERAREGGLNAPFMSIYIPASYQKSGGAMEVADSLIGIVKQLTTDYPDKFAMADSPQQIESQFKEGLISLPMGLENGAPIGNDLKNVKVLYEKGIRYITLTHSKDNQISDSSYDTTGTNGGLSPFGKNVVKEMNRVGIMVDISHVSDSAFYDVMKITEAPVIASHSSARYFTPEFERNMSDSMMVQLAKNNGVIMVNFSSDFISDSSRTTSDTTEAIIERTLKEENWKRSDSEAQEFIKETRETNYHYASLSDVADHFDHIVNLTGIDHVGFGSDFDGVGDTLPVGLKDVSDYPNLIRELLKRGYTKDDIQKITHGNIFRVWNEVAATAEQLSSGKSNQ